MGDVMFEYALFVPEGEQIIVRRIIRFNKPLGAWIIFVPPTMQMETLRGRGSFKTVDEAYEMLHRVHPDVPWSMARKEVA